MEIKTFNTEIIKKKRKALNLTQRALAEESGVSWQTISNLERGENINHLLLQRVCEILGLEVAIVDTNPVEEKKKPIKNNKVSFKL
jgi:transcriptional regulator with XRE-family HTH domain